MSSTREVDVVEGRVNNTVIAGRVLVTGSAIPIKTRIRRVAPNLTFKPEVQTAAARFWQRDAVVKRRHINPVSIVNRSQQATTTCDVPQIVIERTEIQSVDTEQSSTH